MSIDIYTNTKESGDWIVVKFNEFTIFEGHRVSTYDLIDIINAIHGEGLYINHHETTDEEIQCL